VSHSGETTSRIRKSFEVKKWYGSPLLPCLVWLSLDFAHCLGESEKVLFCLFFLFIDHTHERIEVVNATLTLNHLNVETLLMPFDRRRFAVVHSRLILSLRPQMAPPQNVKSTVKFGDFRPSRATQ